MIKMRAYGYEIDENRCEELANLLLELGIPTRKPEEAFAKVDAKDFREFLLWNGAVTTQDTNFIQMKEVNVKNPDNTETAKTVQDKLEGTLDGKPIRAAGGMAQIMQKRWKDSREKFEPEYLSTMTVKQFKEFFSDDNGHYYFEPQGEMLTLRRVGYLRDWGKKVLELYGGDPTKIFEGSSIEGYLTNLRKFKAFREDLPLEKLKHVFIKKVEAAGYLPEPSDIRERKTPIDYVVWESLLKMGIVRPLDKALDEKLKNQERLSYLEIRDGRMACYFALNHVLKQKLFEAEPKTNMYAVDDILFSLGFYYKRKDKLDTWRDRSIADMVNHPEYSTPNTMATLLI